MCRLWCLRMLGMGTLIAASLAMRPGAASAADALLDAKRRAAVQLLHDGKASEALTLLEEVIKADDSAYSDHLLMARANDKLGQSSEALRHYRRVLELGPSAPRDVEEKSARQEAEKRLKVLDPMGTKIEDTFDEFQRKIDALEREAVAARSMAGLERVFRMRGALWQAQKRRDHGFCEVFASGAWQDAGMDVRAGQTYRVRAAGTWRVKGKGEGLTECTAAGTSERPSSSLGRMGQLEAKVEGAFQILGEDATFVAPASGRLYLIENDEGQPARLKNTGSVQVLIEGRS